MKSGGGVHNLFQTQNACAGETGSGKHQEAMLAGLVPPTHWEVIKTYVQRLMPACLAACLFFPSWEQFLHLCLGQGYASDVRSPASLLHPYDHVAFFGCNKRLRNCWCYINTLMRFLGPGSALKLFLGLL